VAKHLHDLFCLLPLRCGWHKLLEALLRNCLTLPLAWQGSFQVDFCLLKRQWQEVLRLEPQLLKPFHPVALAHVWLESSLAER
jgi:uncharacterized protein (DUF2062 family)